MLPSIIVPSSCFTQTWITTPPGGIGAGLVLGNPYNTNCFPVPLSATLSPAKCPQGYVSACAPTNIVIPEETVYDCCPNGYSCDGGYFKCTSAFGSTVTLTVTDLDAAQKPTLKTSVTNGMNAHSIRVRYASSDLATTNTDASSFSTTSTDSASATPSSAMTLATATSKTTSDPSSNGNEQSAALSTGAQAGIGVGVGISVLACSGFVWFFLKRRVRTRSGPSELDCIPRDQSSPLPSKYPAELANASPSLVYEIDSSPSHRSEASELPRPG